MSNIAPKPKTVKVKNQNGAAPKGQPAVKQNGQKLEPIDTQHHNGHGDGPGRSSERGGGSDYDRRVSFRDNLEERPAADHHGDYVTPTTSTNGVEGRARQGSKERVHSETAREPRGQVRSKEDGRQGSLTWRKVSSEPVLLGSGTERSFTTSDDSVIDKLERFSAGRVCVDYEPSGRKFTSKPVKANFGSNTSLSTTTESSDDSDDVFNVILRVRPLNSQETLRRDKFVADFPGDGQVS
ncbi:hypothetical protein Btru_000771, partial [Bulinus truncatus]